MNLVGKPGDYPCMTGSASDAPATPDAGRLFDELLVTMAQAGERSAGERLAARWQPRLLRTARRLLGDDDLARAAVQESWVAIWRGLGKLRDPARFPPWAFAILHRRCVDTIRGAQRQRERLGEAEREPEAGAEPPGDALAIRQAFALLSPDHRLAAQLFFVEGLTLTEIAVVQLVPEGTVKSRLFHARRQLKAALSGDRQ